MRKGSCHSEEARAKNAAAHHGRVPWNKGIKMNADQCVNFGKRRGFAPWNKGLSMASPSAETLAKRSAALRGKPKSIEWRAKIAAALLGKAKSFEARIRMSTAKKGRPAHNKGKMMSPEQRANSGRRPGSIPWNKGIPTGISPMRGPRPEYNGVRFRSSYEVRFAKALDARGIGWQYEPKRFVLGSCSYLPDFFVPETGAFWEIKGWHNASSQMKARLFRELYPEHPLIIATHDVITMMEGSTNGSRHVEDLRSPGLVAQ